MYDTGAQDVVRSQGVQAAWRLGLTAAVFDDGIGHKVPIAAVRAPFQRVGAGRHVHISQRVEVERGGRSAPRRGAGQLQLARAGPLRLEPARPPAERRARVVVKGGRRIVACGVGIRASAEDAATVIDHCRGAVVVGRGVQAAHHDRPAVGFARRNAQDWRKRTHVSVAQEFARQRLAAAVIERGVDVKVCGARVTTPAKAAVALLFRRHPVGAFRALLRAFFASCEYHHLEHDARAAREEAHARSAHTGARVVRGKQRVGAPAVEAATILGLSRWAKARNRQCAQAVAVRGDRVEIEGERVHTAADRTPLVRHSLKIIVEGTT
eukprot:scaffold76121_cov29-Phaeocystis_antarctica.AAC.1